MKSIAAIVSLTGVMLLTTAASAEGRSQACFQVSWNEFISCVDEYGDLEYCNALAEWEYDNCMRGGSGGEDVPAEQ